MKTWPVIFLIVLSWVWGTPSEARRIHLTAEQKTQLEHAQTVLVEVLALTEKGAYEAGPLASTVKARWKTLGMR